MLVISTMWKHLYCCICLLLSVLLTILVMSWLGLFLCIYQWEQLVFVACWRECISPSLGNGLARSFSQAWSGLTWACLTASHVIIICIHPELLKLDSCNFGKLCSKHLYFHNSKFSQTGAGGWDWNTHSNFSSLFGGDLYICVLLLKAQVWLCHM